MKSQRILPLLMLAAALVPAANAQISVTHVGSYATSQPQACEISAYDPQTARLFVINGASNALDVLDISSPASPTLLTSIGLGGYGGPNSVAVRNGIVAVAVASPVKTDPGRVLFLDASGGILNSVTVGALPDMLAFSNNGRYLVVANEGEPNSYNQPDSVDPEGSISVIDMTRGAEGVRQSDVRTADFWAFTREMLPPSVRIFGPGASVAQDMEPEYVAISHDSRTAYVTCQENNAIAVVDLASATVVAIRGLGFKNHALDGNALDPSDRDGGINIRNWPVYGIFMPDAIEAYQYRGETFLVMANEGDARDYLGFNEEARISSLNLDPTVFPNAAFLKQTQNLGRLTATRTLGDIDGDGDYDALYALGARSFSIRRPDGTLVWDSGQALEEITAMIAPTKFNGEGTDASFDSRSDNKGPEPEGVALGNAFGRTYAFIGLERFGGVIVYDVTNPFAPTYAAYANHPLGTDRAPEGLTFIKAEDSPTGLPLLVVSNENSGSISIYQIAKS